MRVQSRRRLTTASTQASVTARHGRTDASGRAVARGNARTAGDQLRAVGMVRGARVQRAQQFADRLGRELTSRG